MGFLSKFEGKMEDTLEGAADKMFDAPISPVQIAKKAEKKMRREKMVGAGKQYAPTLYTVLVNPDDDQRLFGYYPTLAGETETYLAAKAAEQGLVMDGQPLVRFIVDNDLKRGKFDIIAEAVAAPIVVQLRDEEMQRYGLAPASAPMGGRGHAAPAPMPAPAYGAAPAPQAPFGYDGYDGYDQGYGSQDDYYQEDDRGGYLDESYIGQEEPAANGAPAVAHTVAFAAGAAAIDQTPNHQAARARFIDTTNNRTHTLAAARLLVGRESKNDIVVQDINASRTHAELRFEPQGVWTITDLGSTNGTLVNGVEVATQPLREGDRITIGMTNFVFSQS